MRALSWECFPGAGPPSCTDPRFSPEPAYAISGFNQGALRKYLHLQELAPSIWEIQGAWWEVDPDGHSVDSTDSSCIGKHV